MELPPCPVETCSDSTRMNVVLSTLRDRNLQTFLHLLMPSFAQVTTRSSTLEKLRPRDQSNQRHVVALPPQLSSSLEAALHEMRIQYSSCTPTSSNKMAHAQAHIQSARGPCLVPGSPALSHQHVFSLPRDLNSSSWSARSEWPRAVA